MQVPLGRQQRLQRLLGAQDLFVLALQVDAIPADGQLVGRSQGPAGSTGAVILAADRDLDHVAFGQPQHGEVQVMTLAKRGLALGGPDDNLLPAGGIVGRSILDEAEEQANPVQTEIVGAGHLHGQYRLQGNFHAAFQTGQIEARLLVRQDAHRPGTELPAGRPGNVTSR